MERYLVDSVHMAEGPFVSHEILTLEPMEPLNSSPNLSLEFFGPTPSPVPTETPPPRASRTSCEFIDVTDTDYVPEGFHENCREENGSIKITDKNRSHYEPVAHLIKVHGENGWATEKGRLYTPRMTGLPDGAAPTIESITSIQLQGIKLKGRIVCRDGQIVDCDTANAMTEITPTDMPGIIAKWREGMEWHENAKKQGWCRTVAGVGHSLPTGITIRDSVYKTLGVPNGDYHIKKGPTSKRNIDDVMVFTMCDEPSCCIMHHVMLSIATKKGGLTHSDSVRTKDYFGTQVMYTKEDPVEGNCDICYKCITMARYGD